MTEIDSGSRLDQLFSSTLKSIRDNCTVLYNRISVEGYQECKDDILAVSGMAEDIRDALLEYQVNNSKFHAVVMSLKLGWLDR